MNFYHEYFCFWIWRSAISLDVGQVGRPTYPREVFNILLKELQLEKAEVTAVIHVHYQSATINEVVMSVTSKIQ